MNQDTNKKQLRDFGLVVGGILVVIGLWPLMFRGQSLRLWAFGLGVVLMALGAVLPMLLAPVHKVWMWIGHVLGWINTRILLGIVFYGLVTPIGLMFRLIGKDTMRHEIAEASPSYRVVRKPRPRGHMRFQF
ncbi:MAG TPA: SxtJ family membrane protein [Nitrospiraceae bacterium]|nr:SxtJ family membrane protein [Nitrospiraceae bacterium]